MIDVAHALFRFDVPAPSEDLLIGYAQNIFSELDSATTSLLPFNDYSLYVEVEEGSIKGRGKVAVLASTFYFAVVNYGSFRQGLEQIGQDARAVANVIVKTAQDHQLIRDVPPAYVRRDAGDLAEIERLFIKVRDREISPEEATRRTLQILDPDGTQLPRAAHNHIHESFDSVRQNPEQLRLELDVEKSPPVPKEPFPKRRAPAPALRVRVVIERDERDGVPRLRTEYR